MVLLEQYVEDLRASAGADAVPSFDPLDGGSNARVLLLLETPGRKAVGSGFISRDNPDPTARNMLRFLEGAHIPREATVLWNVVPWYLGSPLAIGAADPGDVEAGRTHLPALLNLLGDLEEIVLLGRKAQRIGPWLEETTPFLHLPSFEPSGQPMA